MDEADMVSRDERGVMETRERGGRDGEVGIQVVEDSGEEIMRVRRI